MTDLKIKILEYKKQNPNLGCKLIARALKCDHSTVRYHLHSVYRQAHNLRHFERRRENKQFLVQALGGKCKQCGYDKSIAALDFHHIDPSTKESENKFSDMSREKALKEIKKCVLLCANCHREIHEK